MKVFICTNAEQDIAAKVSKNLLHEKTSLDINDIEILYESDFGELQNIQGQRYLRSGKWNVYKSNDMQSFTFLRFKVPELMNYEGHALVIDPDIFIVKDKLSDLTEMIGKNDILCRKGIKSGNFASSLMFLNCSNLKHWDTSYFIESLMNGSIDYDQLINLTFSNHKIKLLQNCWNDFDNFDEKTIFVHTTQKITQPWRAGLKLNSYIPPLFGFINRDFIYRVLKKPLKIGVDHPNIEISRLFFKSLSAAITSGAIKHNDLNNAIRKSFIRKDILEALERFS